MSERADSAYTGGAGLSGHLDPDVAARQVCEQAAESLGRQPADLALVFVSGAHAPLTERVCRAVGERLEARRIIGVSGEGVLGGETELDQETGVSLLALRMPGVAMHEFTTDELPPLRDELTDEALEELAAGVNTDSQTRAVLLFGDPFSTPLLRLLPALSRMHTHAGCAEPIPVVGGMASAANRPGRNVLVLGERTLRKGAVGLTISGRVTIDAAVSQGCRPVGAPMVVTRARRNIVFSLGNRPAVEAVREAIETMEDADRELLANGMFLGRAVTEYKDRFGRGDFLIRAVMGADENNGAIAVGDLMRTGQTVQLHVRDARSASEDLEFLMSAQSLQSPPIGALLCTCNGRGRRRFKNPGHDALRVATALAATGAPVPVAGFFAAGEIGPVGRESFLHGHSAGVTLFRAGPPPVDPAGARARR